MRRKIFHVITKLELGGAQKVTLMTLERLPRDRYELGLIAGPEGILVNWANQIPELTRFWIPNLVREVRPIQDSITLLKLWNLFRRERPHIVHTHSSKAGILGRLAARLAEAGRRVPGAGSDDEMVSRYLALYDRLVL